MYLQRTVSIEHSSVTREVLLGPSWLKNEYDTCSMMASRATLRNMLVHSFVQFRKAWSFVRCAQQF